MVFNMVIGNGDLLLVIEAITPLMVKLYRWNQVIKHHMYNVLFI